MDYIKAQTILGLIATWTDEQLATALDQRLSNNEAMTEDYLKQLTKGI